MVGVYILAGIVVLLLPLLYDIIIRSSVGSEDYEFKHAIHISLNVLTSVICLVVVLNTRGDFQSRLKTAMVSVSINFGMLLLLILSLRLYYSRPLLIASFFASIALVSIFNILAERYQRRRIGIVPQGLDEETVGQIGPNAVFITSPDEPTWAYDVVLVDWPHVNDPRWMRFATRAILSGCEVHHVAAYVESKQGRVLPEHFETDHAAPPHNSLYVMYYKRILDILFVLALATVAAVIVAVAAGLILLTMGRPILFIQSRMGVDGKPFKMYKLRTMLPAPAGAAVTATRTGDPRITPLGHFLRRFRIDELPQFYNIFKGDMSLVGPRPEQPELARAYARMLPVFSNRTMLRPGITGWAQVRGKYAADEKETMHKLAYDLYYLKHASLAMDLSILAHTFKTLLTGNSAR